MSTPITSRSVSDKATTDDQLGFTPYVEALANLITAKETDTPLTIGVFGPWGSGKTSLMRMMERRIGAKTPGLSRVWFDAWKYEREEALWRALVVRVLSELRPKKDKEALDEAEQALVRRLDDLEASLYRVVDREEAGELRIDWGKVAKGTSKAAVHLAFSAIPALGVVLPKLGTLPDDGLGALFAAVKQEQQRIYRAHVESLEQFQDSFQTLVEEQVLTRGGKLVIFVDDLDRCLPEKAVEVLEAIKLFMDVRGCIFVLGLDRTVVARAIEIRYKEMKLLTGEGEASQLAIQGRRYLEKIIQIPFKIPPVGRQMREQYVESLISHWPDEACKGVFGVGTDESPRSIKRMVNTFLLLWEISKERDKALRAENEAPMGIKSVRLAKVVVLQHIAPAAYAELEKQPRLLGDLEVYYRREAASQRRLERTAEPERGDGPAGSTESVAPILKPYVGRPGLKRLLTLHPLETPEVNFARSEGSQVMGLKSEELSPYFTLAQQVTLSAEAELEEVPSRMSIEPEMVQVPAGAFRMGTAEDEVPVAKKLGADDTYLKREKPQHEVYLSGYFIGKYPVTNREYQAFVSAAGHRSPEHWKGAEPPEGKGGHPVVNVSWEDATAYCQWLGKETGKDYGLPTEAQWEKAARGPDARIFPWGHDWDPERVNSSEKGPGETTAVGSYSPAGDSPYGAADMAGNVWEWCQDWSSETTYTDRKGSVRDPKGPEKGTTRVLRGGSFHYLDGHVRCAARGHGNPLKRNGNLGFRIVLRPSLNDEASGR
ncbi:MAG: SUMF1/EgtB/PvdO family nonheme iron enzyme [Bacteroidota bacterium]